MRHMSDSEMDQEMGVKAEVNNSKTNPDARIYEVGYLLVPTIAGEEVPAVYTAHKDLIVSLGGEMISDEMPRQINLAYTMLKVVANVRSRFNTVYFGCGKFEMNPTKSTTPKAKLDFDPLYIRFLVTKTSLKKTPSPRRDSSTEMVLAEKLLLQKKEEGEVTAPINKEEVDKEIEAMVAAV